MDARERYELAERRLLDRYGIEAKSRYIDILQPRIRLRVLETGVGAPVVFVHGGGGAAMNWIPLLAHLSGVRALVVDRPGHGLSDTFDYRGVDLRRHAVSVVTAVADAFSVRRVPIVANSMGAAWALWTALDAAERVASLALLGCPAFLLGTGAPASLRVLSVPYLNRALMRMQPANERGALMMWRRMSADVSRLCPEFIDATAAVLAIPSTAIGWRTLLENSVRLAGPLPYGFAESELRRVGQRTVFIWGSRDPFGAPDVGRRAAALMADAAIEVVDEGHLPWLDDPARTGRLLTPHLEIAGIGEAPREVVTSGV